MISFKQFFLESTEPYARHAELERKYNEGTITPEEIEEAERIVKRVANENGYSVEAYHGTTIGGFTEFDTNRRGYHFGDGSYFAPKKSKAEEHQGVSYRWNNDDMVKIDPPEGSQLYHVFLKIENPYNISSDSEIDIIGYRLSNNNRPEYDRLAEIVRSRSNRHGSIGGIEVGNEWVREKGHDSIVKWDRNEMIEIVMFHPSQIKSAEPFTGVPLEKRFNPKSNSINESVETKIKITPSQVYSNNVRLTYSSLDEDSDLYSEFPNGNVWIIENITNLNGKVSQGEASSVLKEFLKHARANGKDVVLQAVPQKHFDIKKWYERNGFVDNGDYMVYWSKQNKPVSNFTDLDREYLAAVERGDMETAQKMVDEAAWSAMDKPIKVYHGTTSKPFTEFKLTERPTPFVWNDPEGMIEREGFASPQSQYMMIRIEPSNSGYIVKALNGNKAVGKVFETLSDAIKAVEDGRPDKKISDRPAFFFATNRLYAEFFSAHSGNGVTARESGHSRVMTVFIGRKKIFDFRDKRTREWLQNWISKNRDYIERETTLWDFEFSKNAAIKNLRQGNWGIFEAFPKITDDLKSEGYTGYTTLEGGVLRWLEQEDDAEYYRRQAQNFGRGGLDVSINYAIFNPSDIKSAEPVTYDEQGNIIPLSKRFNPKSNSINESQKLSQKDLLKESTWTKLFRYHFLNL